MPGVALVCASAASGATRASPSSAAAMAPYPATRHVLGRGDILDSRLGLTVRMVKQLARADALAKVDGERGVTGRLERRRDRFRSMASCVSALSSIVANGHQVLPSFPPPPLFIPYGGFSRIKCGAPHFTGYVVKEKMWRTGRNTPPLLGFSDFLRHILFSTRRVRERVK